MAMFGPIFDALNDAGVRYVVVGGLAVVLHGHVRFTKDLDLIIDLEPEAARRAMRALASQGFVPKVPVAAQDFADPELRETWVRERNLMVFSLHDAANPLRVVDVFARSPRPFEDLFRRSKLVAVGRSTVHVACIEDLISLKREAGRPQDLLDVEVLESIQTLQEKGE